MTRENISSKRGGAKREGIPEILFCEQQNEQQVHHELHLLHAEDGRYYILLLLGQCGIG